jgi:hypothetical protein
MRAVLIAFVLFSGVAHADELTVARMHYQRGTKAYDLGFYEDAIREYMLAYQAKDDPAILYNLAQVNRLAGHAPEALRLYRIYLLKLPRAQNRSDVEHKIGELERTIAKQQKGLPPDQLIRPNPPVAESAPPPPVEPPAEPPAPPAAAPAPAPPAAVETARPVQRPSRGLKIGGLSSGAVGIAALGVGVGMAALATQTSDEISRSATFDPGRLGDFRTYQTLEGVFLGVGAAALVSGVVIYAVAWHRSGSPRLGK